ncbi:MAG: GNAT family N-acetyltransferase [Anaerolineales bacterium]
MNPSPNIILTPFQPQHQSAAKNLILAGLEEHWGTLDLSKNPDLNDIASSYAHGLFLVALLDDQIIGTGAIVPTSDHNAEVVRMSVSKTMRRMGVGKLILNKLCEHARSIGCKRIILETTETWQDAIGFYQTFGFQITHYLDGDVYFSLDL